MYTSSNNSNESNTNSYSSKSSSNTTKEKTRRNFESFEKLVSINNQNTIKINKSLLPSISNQHIDVFLSYYMPDNSPIKKFAATTSINPKNNAKVEGFKKVKLPFLNKNNNFARDNKSILIKTLNKNEKNYNNLRTNYSSSTSKYGYLNNSYIITTQTLDNLKTNKKSNDSLTNLDIYNKNIENQSFSPIHNKSISTNLDVTANNLNARIINRKSTLKINNRQSTKKLTLSSKNIISHLLDLNAGLFTDSTSTEVDNFKKAKFTTNAFCKQELMLLKNYSVFGVIEGLGECPQEVCAGIRHNIIEYLNDFRKMSNNDKQKINIKDFSNEENFIKYLHTSNYVNLKEMFAFCENFSKKGKYDYFNSGGTVTACILLEKTLITVHVGDSMAVLYTRDGKYKELNKIHDFTNVEEVSRLLKSEAIFEKCKFTGNSFAYSKKYSNIKVAVSRCVGMNSLNCIGVNNVPEISLIDLGDANSPNYCYLVIGTGLFWQLMSNEDIHKIVEDAGFSDADPTKLCQRLVTEALKYKANVSRNYTN